MTHKYLCLAMVLAINVLACQSAEKRQAPIEGWYLPSWEIESPVKDYAATWANDPLDMNKKVLRFELRSGDAFINGEKKSFRAEVGTNFYPEINSICKYKFDLYMPTKFPLENNRLVVAQWWAKTKKYLGEVARSPALALRVRKNKLYVTVRHSDQRVITDADAVPEEQIYQTTEIKLGVWNQYEFEVKWSYRAGGYVLVKVNGKAVANYQGPVGYNDDVGPEFRFGLYRDDSLSTYIDYFRNVEFSCK